MKHVNLDGSTNTLRNLNSKYYEVKILQSNEPVACMLYKSMKTLYIHYLELVSYRVCIKSTQISFRKTDEMFFYYIYYDLFATKSQKSSKFIPRALTHFCQLPFLT